MTTLPKIAATLAAVMLGISLAPTGLSSAVTSVHAIADSPWDGMDGTGSYLVLADSPWDGMHGTGLGTNNLG